MLDVLFKNEKAADKGGQRGFSGAEALALGNRIAKETRRGGAYDGKDGQGHQHLHKRKASGPVKRGHGGASQAEERRAAGPP